MFSLLVIFCTIRKCRNVYLGQVKNT